MVRMRGSLDLCCLWVENRFYELTPTTVSEGYMNKGEILADKMIIVVESG